MLATGRELTQALYVAAMALGRTQDAEEVVRAAIGETQRASGVEAVSLYFLDASRATLILREYAGTAPGFRDQMAVLSLSTARIAETAMRERRVVTADVSRDPSPALRDLYQRHGFRYLTGVPVGGREEILDVLHLASRQEPTLTADETALVQAIGGLVGVALENAALREKMTAQKVWEKDSAIHVTVRDDGEGFDVEAALGRRGERGLGLIGMRERVVEALGGEFTIRSGPGKGTEVAVTIPPRRAE